jgi:hypothetical protein
VDDGEHSEPKIPGLRRATITNTGPKLDYYYPLYLGDIAPTDYAACYPLREKVSTITDIADVFIDYGKPIRDAYPDAKDKALVLNQGQDVELGKKWLV